MSAPLVWLPSVPSTMDEAHARAAAGAPHGTAVAAEEQTAGRGRRGRPWSSPPGGLWLSVVCRPQSGTLPDCLSLRIGLAVAAVLERACPGLPMLRVKWPNDLLLADRKVCGILCEARWEATRLAWIVAAVGINVTNQIPADLGSVVARLDEFDRSVTVERLARPVAVAIAGAAEVPGPLSQVERADFDRRDCLRGRRISAPLSGIAAGVAPDGALLVEREGALVRVPAGEPVSLQ